MKGGLIPFLAYDPAQEYPYNFPNGFAGINRAVGGAFLGSANVTGLTANTIGLSGLPAVFTLVEGDYISLVQSTEIYGLFQVAADVSSSSGFMTATVEPTIKTTIFTTGSYANFVRPACVMIPIAESWSYEPDSMSFPGATWEAIQKPF
jgi:hypothetical protein